MSRWTEFHERHRRQGFAPAFNGFLDAQISDADEHIKVRVCAWLLRRSWGNWSDSCVDGENVIQGQADCARDLDVDRRAVNPAFRSFERGGYIRCDGREIFVVDDPRGMFVGLSPNDAPYPDPRRNRLSDFHYFTEHIWGAANPEKFQRLQEIEREHKQIRTEILSQFKEHRRKLETEENQLSERGGQLASEGRPQGADEPAETGGQSRGNGRTNAGRILITGTKETGEPTTTTAPPPRTGPLDLISQALSEYGHPDPETAFVLARSCHKNAPDAKPEEIVHFVHLKGQQITSRVENPVGLLLSTVPKHFRGDFRSRLPDALLIRRVLKETPTDIYEARRQHVRQEFMERVFQDLEDEQKQREAGADEEAFDYAR